MYRSLQEPINNNSSRKKLLLHKLEAIEYISMSVIRDMLKMSQWKSIILAEKSVIRLIMEFIRNELRNHPYLHGEGFIRKDVSVPWYEIGLLNGNSMRAFAYGAPGERHLGASMCGQDADNIYIYDRGLSEKEYTNYIWPILQTTPETKLEVIMDDPAELIAKVNIEAEYFYQVNL